MSKKFLAFLPLYLGALPPARSLLVLSTPASVLASVAEEMWMGL